MKSLIQSLKFVARQAGVTKLVDILQTPVVNGYVSTTKKLQNPRDVYPLPFHIAISFKHYDNIMSKTIVDLHLPD